MNKQQADCISDLECRFNELQQFNQILQKRLKLIELLENNGCGPQECLNNSLPIGSPVGSGNMDAGTHGTRSSHNMETGMGISPLMYQLMIDNKIMENRVRE